MPLMLCPETGHKTAPVFVVNPAVSRVVVDYYSGCILICGDDRRHGAVDGAAQQQQIATWKETTCCYFFISRHSLQLQHSYY